MRFPPSQVRRDDISARRAGGQVSAGLHVRVEMKRVLVIASSTLLIGVAVPRPATANEWGGAVELGASRILKAEEIFENSWNLSFTGYRRWRGRYYPGVFVEYRSALDAGPATSFWFADLGLRFLSVFGRGCARVDVGWAFRHIALDQENVSSTVGAPLLGLGAGVVLVRTRRGALDLLAVSHMTRAFADEESWNADIGLALSWHYYSE